MLHPCTCAQPPSSQPDANCCSHAKQIATRRGSREVLGNKNAAIMFDVTCPIMFFSRRLKQNACTLNQPHPVSVLSHLKGSEALRFHGANRPAGLKKPSPCRSFLSASAAQSVQTEIFPLFTSWPDPDEINRSLACTHPQHTLCPVSLRYETLIYLSALEYVTNLLLPGPGEEVWDIAGSCPTSQGRRRTLGAEELT